MSVKSFYPKPMQAWSNRTTWCKAQSKPALAIHAKPRPSWKRIADVQNCPMMPPQQWIVWTSRSRQACSTVTLISRLLSNVTSPWQWVLVWWDLDITEMETVLELIRTHWRWPWEANLGKTKTPWGCLWKATMDLRVPSNLPCSI